MLGYRLVLKAVGGLALGFAIALGAAPGLALTLEESRHLLTRTGFGASPEEMSSLLALSRAQAVDRLLGETRQRSVVPPPKWTAAPKPQYWGQESWSQDERDAFRLARTAEIRELKSWWFAEMIVTPSPLTERMVLFWHNHFTSSFEGTVHWSHMLYDQNALFRAKGLGDFGTLLRAILHDPAMLRYLDNHLNRKGKPNENLARELLELFTLGEGHYRETDIKEIARALSGWTVDAKNDFVFVVNQRQHDDGIKTIFGESGKFDGDDVARILLARQRMAEFVVEKLWREFVSDAPSREAVGRLAEGFRASGYSIKALLRELFLSTEFWAPENRASLVKSPVELIVGTLRSFALPVADVNALPALSKRLGQDVFDPPNVKGWAGGKTWINPAWLLLRYQTIDRLISARDVDQAPVMSAAAAPMGSALRALVGGEACRGAPHMVVHANGTKLAELVIDHAQDGEKLGRALDAAELDKRVVEIPLPWPARDVKVVTISFVNDFSLKDQSGYAFCDRNLFVDWIELDGRRFATQAGTQVHECKATPSPGRLYCNGALTMDLAVLDASGSGGDMMMPSGMMATVDPARRAMMAMPRESPEIDAHLRRRSLVPSFERWAKALPVEAQDSADLWRAVTPLPPLAGSMSGADVETALRRLASDVVYQLR